MRLDDTSTQECSLAAPASVREFRRAFRNHPSGVAVISGDDGTGPVALTVSSIFSVSVEPPMLGFSASTASSSASRLRQAASLVVHLIAPDEVWLPKLAATPGADRFAGVEWDRLTSGEPYYPQIRTWMRCRTEATVEVDGAAVLVVEVLDIHTDDHESVPASGGLVYYDRDWHRLGASTRIPSGAHSGDESPAGTHQQA